MRDGPTQLARHSCGRSRQSWRLRRTSSRIEPSTSAHLGDPCAAVPATTSVKHIAPESTPTINLREAIYEHLESCARMTHREWRVSRARGDRGNPADADCISLRALLESFEVVRCGMGCTGIDNGKRPIHLIIVGKSIQRLYSVLLEGGELNEARRLTRFMLAAAAAFLIEFRLARNLVVSLAQTRAFKEGEVSQWLAAAAPPADSAPSISSSIGFRAHCATDARSMALRQAVRSLLSDGLAVCREHLPDEHLLRTAAAEARELYAAGLMHASNVKQSNARRYTDTSSRGDVVRWLDGGDARAPACSALAQWLRGELLDAVRSACAAAPAGSHAGSGRAPSLCLQGGEILPISMLACYPGGGALFKRHVDNSADAPDERAVTAIIYLNPEWTPADGGMLRVFPMRGEEAAPALEVAPTCGTLVLFWSHRVPHEVMPASTPRYALSLWMTVDAARQATGWMDG